MLALAYVICERRRLGEAGAQGVGPLPVNVHQTGGWHAEARFLIPDADELQALLHAANVADRPHPAQMSVQVSADLLFEDGDITGETWLTRTDLSALLAHAAPDMHDRLCAWEAFARALETTGHETRCIVWFIR
ncbi:hypothetical protein [Deinococcus aerophilus]|uniref:DUF3145 domain-containing protein n=1 Tax=Deinococcus aerophilus TaxID=522488 RepID=A0ABQ2GNW3_9DEIO|nr:hypothetical protein [Deinococcus aerophilus]GGM05821.1 hypothetical protein GCM10010841_12700 [Deinococcus aerophilus]